MRRGCVGLIDTIATSSCAYAHISLDVFRGQHSCDVNSAEGNCVY